MFTETIYLAYRDKLLLGASTEHEQAKAICKREWDARGEYIPLRWRPATSGHNPHVATRSQLIERSGVYEIRTILLHRQPCNEEVARLHTLLGDCADVLVSLRQRGNRLTKRLGELLYHERNYTMGMVQTDQDIAPWGSGLSMTDELLARIAAALRADAADTPPVRSSASPVPFQS